jgi:hypothetical protein
MNNACPITVLMMPVYYINDVTVTSDDIQKAKDSWGLIITDSSPAFLMRKKESDYDNQSCISWFYSVFYARLFNVHPMVSEMGE